MSYNFSQNWPLAQQCRFTVTNTRLHFIFPFIFIILKIPARFKTIKALICTRKQNTETLWFIK